MNHAAARSHPLPRFVHSKLSCTPIDRFFRRAATLPQLGGPIVVMGMALQDAVRANAVATSCRPPSRRCSLNKCGPTSLCLIPRCVIWLSRCLAVFVSFSIWHFCSRPGSSPLQRSLGDVPKTCRRAGAISCPYAGRCGIELEEEFSATGWSVIRTGPVVDEALAHCQRTDWQRPVWVKPRRTRKLTRSESSCAPFGLGREHPEDRWPPKEYNARPLRDRVCLQTLFNGPERGSEFSHRPAFLRAAAALIWEQQP